ncbi:hypothetical protein SS50377_22573 [Spironucleus salmonicida]|uniref:Uncharacterized protein n=1 Tax=Spironucleus salmonicida TaxID=348837 RepID=V6LBS2_9EUKA|nr:hypothetical protein SS50377_22573 [Spironucleus salmonicida]|eukprot:EST41935.1 hypothetical protein SS50377_18239 [Spironucleus salmonicida]
MESLSPLNSIKIQNQVAKPEYDQSRVVTYEVTFRNVLGIKMPKILTVSFQELKIQLSDPENAKLVAEIPASNLKIAIPSENIASQVTILCRQGGREAYKVWVQNGDDLRVKNIIRDINEVVQLYQDRLVE